MLEKIKYSDAFKKGLNYVLYDSEMETRKNVILDTSSLESIGYYDGYQYGEYCERAGLEMSISQEHLIAVIDKAFLKAYDIYTENQNNVHEKNKVK